jgi:hypothetical protein
MNTRQNVIIGLLAVLILCLFTVIMAMLAINATRTAAPPPIIQATVTSSYVRPIQWATSTPERMDYQMPTDVPNNPKQAEIDYLTQSVPYCQAMYQTDVNLSTLFGEAGQAGSTIFLDPAWKAQVYNNMDIEVNDSAILANMTAPPDMVQLQMIWIDMHTHAVAARSYMTTGLENVDPNYVTLANGEMQAMGTDIEQATAFLKAYQQQFKGAE